MRDDFSFTWPFLWDLILRFSFLLSVMNSKSSRSKCRHCGKIFSPDYRNRHHQHYCPDPDCRRVSKTASQRRWLRQAQNRDYFQGPEQTRRVQQWRKSNPGYWKKQPTVPPRTQRAESQPRGEVQKSCNVPNGLAAPIQDVCLVQNTLFVGLISAIAGSTLQEDIAATIRELQTQGRKILGLKPSDQCDTKRCPKYDCQKQPLAESPAANFGQVWPDCLQHPGGDGDALRQSSLPGLILHD
jgi:hypothetical protein